MKFSKGVNKDNRHLEYTIGATNFINESLEAITIWLSITNTITSAVLIT